jgi:NtrC-family two-component system sensor histidine kinase KinB
MTLKRKLSLGLGFLFLIIFSLEIFFSLEIGRLSRDAANIIKDNYNSLVYSRNMLSALEDMRTAVSRIALNPSEDGQTAGYDLKLYEAGRAEFERNLGSEKGNITEIQERDYVGSLDKGYGLFTDIAAQIMQAKGGGGVFFGEFQPAFSQLRHTIGSIFDLNMQAVERKNQRAARDSATIINLTAGIGVVCAILAFVYFWYFPFYVSNTLAYLSERMKKLLEEAEIKLDLKTNDESFIILQGINLLSNKLAGKDQKGPAGK